MVERRRKARLALEILQMRFERCCCQELDRDGAVQARVHRLVDLSHSPGSEKGLDAVRADLYSLERRLLLEEQRCLQRWVLQKIVSEQLSGQQRPDFLQESSITCTDFLQESRPFLRRMLERGLEQVVDLLPPLCTVGRLEVRIACHSRLKFWSKIFRIIAPVGKRYLDGAHLRSILDSEILSAAEALYNRAPNHPR